MLTRRKLINGAGALAVSTAIPREPASAAWAQFMASSGGGAAPATGWSQLPIGGGGFARSLSVNPTDGTILLRTDTAGAWIWNGAKWVTVFGNGSMPASLFTGQNNWLPGYAGVYEIVSAPSNSSVVYMCYLDNLYVSTNKCVSWSATSLSVTKAGGFSYVFPANTKFDCAGPRIAVDPQNSNIAFVGTIGSGVYYTLNGGTTWTQIANGSIPFNSNWTHTIWFDTTSSVVSGATQGIYISSYGNGLYHSTDGGATWALVASSPTTICRSQMVGANYYCLTNPSGGAAGSNLTISGSNVQTYISGAWSTIVTTANQTETFAVNPNNVNQIVWIQGNGSPRLSQNAGSTFSQASSYTGSGTIPWQVFPGVGDSFISAGNCFFDGRTANTLAIAHGTGISTLPIPVSGGWPAGVAAYTLNMMGEESLVGNILVYLPNNHGIAIRNDDFPIMVADGTNYPPAYFPAGTAAFNNGFGVSVSGLERDATGGTGTLITQLGAQSIISSDWGVTWSAMPNIPSTGIGVCAASTATNWLFLQRNTNLWGTNNAGTTWSAISVGGIANTGGYTLVADRVTANTYYLYTAPGNGAATSLNSILYTITYSAGSWAVATTFTGMIGSGSVFEYPGYMRAVPGNAGHLFWGFGINGGSALQTGSTSYKFAFSSDGGATWTVLPGVCSPIVFAFGPAASGQSYPSIYVVGYDVATQAVFGLYRCINFNPSTPSAATFTLLGSSNANFAPAGNLVDIGWLDADPTNYGYIAMSTQGQGYVKGYFP